MFLNMIRFEWRYYVRQPSFYVTMMVFFLLPFLATVSENVQIGGGGNVFYNSSYAIAQTMLILGIFAMFLVVNFVASTAIRNDVNHMSEIAYSKPIQPLPYQLGRFIGTYLVVLVVFAMVPLGILVGTLMPWVDSERLGPTNLAFYVSTFVYFSIPSLFVLSCLFYTVAVKFRSLMAVYLVAVGLFIIYIVAGSFLNEPEYRSIVALTDPFGIRAYGDVTRYWTTYEKNNNIVEFTGILAQSRMLWLAIGIGILALFGGLNKRMALANKAEKKSRKKSKNSEPEVAPLGNRVNYRGGHESGWAQFATRTKFEMRQVIFSAPFYILMIFSAFNLIGQFVDPTGMYGAPNWPLTQTMVTQITNSFGLMMLIIVTYYSAEVVWRERSSGMGDIVDSMPVFNLTFWLSKLLSVFLVISILLLVGMVVSIVNQAVKGYNQFDLSQYLISLFFFNALPLFITTVLAFFIQVLSPNKFVGMLIFVAYILSSLVFSELGLEHNMYNYGESPTMNYSDMNGYGWYLETQAWYMTYWSALALALSAIGYAMWQRGPQVSIKARAKMLAYQLGTKGRVTLAASLLVFVSTGGFIYYNTQILNEFYLSDDALDLRADYEKQFIQYAEDPFPTITTVNAKVDIRPKERVLDAVIDVNMVNKSAQPIDKFLVYAPRHAQDWAVKIDGATLTDFNDTFETGWMVFDTPLQPGERVSGQLSVSRDHKGFKDRNFDTTLVENGTFVNNFELFPGFGFNYNAYITDRHERRKRDLPPPRRANKLEDERFYNQSFFGAGVDFIDFEATISTDLDQTAIAPGYLQKSWQENERAYFHYKMDRPMVNFYSFLSARLEVKKEMHKGISVEVYYHPAHDMNIDVMIESTKASIDYFGDNFGPYQHKQMRIIEFPGYRSFAQSFANTVPYSEQIGFITDLRDPEEIDPVFYITAHELAHQWWGHQLNAADVQGSAILSETLSQYSAIMVAAHKYGEHKLRKFLKYELDTYLRGRTREILEEMPLLRAENQGYIHYRKGSVIMMALHDKLGEQRLNKALNSFMEKYRYQTTPYPTTLDLVAELNAVSNEQEQKFVARLFEDITLYDLKAKEVSFAAMDNGKNKITFKIDAKVFTADGQGLETEGKLNEMIDVVIFSDDPEDLTADNTVLYQQKHLIQTGENVIEIEVEGDPKFAGVDPFIKLVDRDSADNLIKF